jgi:hypothetical protein
MAKPINWTPEELAWIEKNKLMVRPEAYKLFCQTFSRTNIKFSAYAELCKRKGWRTGRTGQFSKGSVPANKGKKMPFNANSAKTQFKKGHLSGFAKENKKPIGAKVIREDGYVYQKMNNDLPYYKRWSVVHVMLWEKINGPKPDGHCLKCIDGDRTNTDPDNWELINLSMLPRLAGRWATPYDSAPDELKPAILATAKLVQANREIKKKKDFGHG